MCLPSCFHFVHGNNESGKSINIIIIGIFDLNPGLNRAKHFVFGWNSSSVELFFIRSFVVGKE